MQRTMAIAVLQHRVNMSKLNALLKPAMYSVVKQLPIIVMRFVATTYAIYIKVASTILG
jgi:hypothetical protein